MHARTLRALTLALVATGVLAAAPQPAQAGVPIVYSTGEVLSKVVTLPSDERFTTATGQHVDLGYRYRELSIFWIPLWQWDGKWCGHVGSDKEYIDLAPADVQAIVKEAGVTLPANPISFWHAWGGKLVASAILLVLLMMGLANRDKVPPEGENAAT